MRKPGKIDRNHNANLKNYLQDCIAITKTPSSPEPSKNAPQWVWPRSCWETSADLSERSVARNVCFHRLRDRREEKKKYSFGEGETWEKHAMISYQLHPLKTWSERLRDLQIKGAAAVKTHLFHFNSFPIYNTRLVRTCMFWVRCRISVTYSGKEKSRTYWKRSKHAELQYIHCARIVHENRREITELKKNMWPS